MGKRKINSVVVSGLLVLLALLSVFSLTGCSWQDTDQVADSSAPFYPDRVVTVHFVMTDEDWAYLQANAREESYVKADMWYDGELVPDIALRPKGNSSLSSTISSGSIRFSLKADLNFFNAARNLDGVKKLNFNNGWSDPTFIREMLSYELFEQMGLPSPRTAFVDVYVNDTHLGLYTMVEQIDQTFLARYFTDTSGNLYKPEMPAGYLNWTEEDLPDTPTTDTNNIFGVNLGGGNFAEILKALGWDFAAEEETVTVPVFPGFGGDFNFGNMPAANVTPGFRPGIGNLPQNLPPLGGNASNNFTQRNVLQPGMGFMGGGGMMQGLQGNYLDQMSLKTNENKPEHSALLRLLEVLNNEPDATFVEEIEKVLDVDQVLRFLAVSAVLVHLDNYTGMGHNYYLYEVDGKFTIIPWDLNMSFGNFNSGLDLDGIINFLIDEPTAGAVADRPLVARLLEVPEYQEAYHQYIVEMIDGPFSFDVMNTRINELARLIRPYVYADTLKFYSNKAFEAYIGAGAVVAETTRFTGMGFNIGLKAFIAERIDSIRKQLAGELPSTNNGQGNGSSFFMGGGNIFNRPNQGQ